METRTERYKKYREQILAMTDDFFSPDGTCVKRLTREEIKAAPDFESAGDVAVNFASNQVDEPIRNDSSNEQEKEKKLTPYTKYLAQRKKLRIAKFIIAGLAFIGLILFFVFFVGGPENG